MVVELPRVNRDDQIQRFPDQFNQTMEELENSLNEFDRKMIDTNEKIEPGYVESPSDKKIREL